MAATDKCGQDKFGLAKCDLDKCGLAKCVKDLEAAGREQMVAKCENLSVRFEALF